MEKLLRRSSCSFIIPYIRNNPGFKLPGLPSSRCLSEFWSGSPAARGLGGVRVYSIGGSRRETNVRSQKEVQMAAPDGFMGPSWVKWITGSVVSLALSLWSWRLWKKIPLITGNVEEIMEEIEVVAEVVEKVANVAEKVSERVADSLPDDNKLKEAALIVEHLSMATAEEAQITQDIIHKVDGVKQDVEELLDIGGDIVRRGSQGKNDCLTSTAATPTVPFSQTR